MVYHPRGFSVVFQPVYLGRGQRIFAERDSVVGLPTVGCRALLSRFQLAGQASLPL